MPISDQDLRRIAAQATPLFERFRNGCVPVNTDKCQHLIDHRFDRWLQTAAYGDKDLLLKRLSWDGLDEATVRPVLGDIQLADTHPLPDWAETLKDTLTIASALDLKALWKREDPSWQFLDFKQEMLFEEALVPFVLLARERVSVGIESYKNLPDKTRAYIERALLVSLGRIAAQVLYLEYSVFRHQAGLDVALARNLGTTPENPSKEIYRSFIRHLYNGGIEAIFSEYTVLARLLAIRTQFWADFITEFLQRLDADLPAIQEAFFEGIDPGNIEGLQVGLSDSHKQGRSVVLVRFGTGRKLVYKPKDMGLEESYVKLLNWFNTHDAPYPFKPLIVLNRGEYGWVEFVEPIPGEGSDDIHRFYTHAGALICLLYTLQSTDVHSDNIIACKDQPVLIDMETLVYPDMQTAADEEKAWTMAEKLLRNSVMKTGFMPSWKVSAEGKAYDTSALGFDQQQETDYLFQKWQHVNTDGLFLGLDHGTMGKRPNAPVLDGEQMYFGAYRQEILTGFATMYQYLLTNRDALMQHDGPVCLFEHRQVRYILRNTDLYARVLTRGIEPDMLRNGVDQSIEFDMLCRRYIRDENRPETWRVLQAEYDDLNVGDIPYFSIRADSRQLLVSGQQSVADYFSYSGYQLMIDRFKSHDEEDMARQLSIMDASFTSRLTVHDTTTPDIPPEDTVKEVPSLSREEKIRQAVSIAEDLYKWSIVAPDGSAAWIGLDYIIRADQYQLGAIGQSLYSGCPGISFFLAALERVTGGAGYRDMALGGLSMIRMGIEDARNDPIAFQRWGLGAGNGLGAVVYTLTRTGIFLDDPSLIADAEYAATLITPERVASSLYLDVLGGTAGAILGLLTLYQENADNTVLERAVQCGRSLVEHRIEAEGGSLVWPWPDSRPLTGMSHGAGGNAYALLRLYDHTGEDTFRTAALEAIAYENSVFSDERQNWPDFRAFEKKKERPPGYPVQWCHGAPGIGLARLGCLPAIAGSEAATEFQKDIEVAAETTVKQHISGHDHLCCGSFGRIDFLLEAGRKMDRPVLVETAERFAARAIRRAEQNQTFHFPGEMPNNSYSPSLFRGTAGIGYELLRFVEPEMMPCVLRWE